MNLQERFNSIQQFLAQYQSIWSRETLNHYPYTLEDYPKEWIKELEEFSDRELWALDSFHQMERSANSQLFPFIEQIKKLIHIEKDDNSQCQFESWAFMRVNAKKRHEIEKISAVIKKIQSAHPIEKGVDIGGGVGHLARVLAHYCNLEMTSIDNNPHLHELGKKRVKKFPTPVDARPISFETLKFTSDAPQLRKLFDKRCMSIGLHTCGPLAVQHLRASKDHHVGGIFNFGCCYAKMDPKMDLPLSLHAKNKKMLDMTIHSLSLAARGHSTNDYNDFLLKKRVKSMRYTLHLFLYHKLNHREFISVGETKARSYWQNFSWYAKTKLAQLNIKHHWTDQQLDNYFKDPDTQNKVNALFLANLIRWQLGRVVEVYILLDRAIFLQENDYEVSLKEYFKESLSPRNLGILALKKRALL